MVTVVVDVVDRLPLAAVTPIEADAAAAAAAAANKRDFHVD